MVLESIHGPPRDLGAQHDSRDFATTRHMSEVESSESSETKEKNEFSVSEKSNSNSDLTQVPTNENGQQDMDAIEKRFTTYEQASNGLLYRDGQLVLQPAPTQDPRDPLNMSFTRKILAVLCLCFFGAFAAAAELILGAMLPVFALQYAGIEPGPTLMLLQENGGIPAGADPLASIAHLTPNAPPIWKVYLLASLPVLMIGISNMGLIPVAIACGRRPVVLICGLVAIVGAIWAGFSGSLGSHLGARCLQALGAGTVESLIPFIIQDIVHVHKRNTWISMLFACQGTIIIALGFGAPYIIVYQTWRWVYFYTAMVAAAFLIGVFFLLPETRWQRTRAEMNGEPRDETGMAFEPRTWKYDLALFHGKMEWRKGWNAFVDTLRTFFYPQIFFITMLNSAMIACAFASGYVAAPALLTAPWSWPFLNLGFSLVPTLIAAICVGFLTGHVADWTANLVAKKRGKRIPENQLLNLVLPTICALVGALIYGLAGSNLEKYSWGIFLLGLGLMGFGFLGANTVGAVYVLECYPHLAGPALVNIASFRCLIAFVLSFRVSEWIVDFGYLNSMLIYVGLMAFFALLIPVVYVFGPSWRRRWPAEHFGEH